MKTFRIVARMVLVVSSVLYASCSAQADQNPNSPSAQAALRGTEWSLVELNGKEIAVTGRKPPTLLLAAAGGRASGFAGCNSFSGSYTQTSEKLQVTGIAMTRMFCGDAMELEKQYTAALESTQTYRLKGPRLELLRGDTVVAAFTTR